MHYRVFQYPLPVPPELGDLNTYLNGHRVAGVTQYLAGCAGGSMLVFVVEVAAPAEIQLELDWVGPEKGDAGAPTRGGDEGEK